jgi:hypothetical protein
MKIFKKLVFVLGPIFIYFSCQVATTVTGVYSSSKNHNKFIIHEDSTFEYSYYIVAGYADKISSGKWRQINKNTIILNSNIRTNIIPLYIEVIPTQNEKNNVKLSLNVFGKNKKDYLCVPYSNETYFLPDFFPDRGDYDFESALPITHLFFKIYKEPLILERFGPQREYNILETESRSINLTKGDSIHISINLSDSLFFYEVFDNTILKINGNTLTFKDSKNKKNKLSLKQ